MPQPVHVPVLPAEVIDWLNPQSGQIIVDGTLGGGGHTRLIAERLAGEAGFVLALDRDPAAVVSVPPVAAGAAVIPVASVPLVTVDVVATLAPATGALCTVSRSTTERS